ncbi:uncharacterized protein LOC123545371 [Mercenaria mercenaria]|uniref:uncharacterized protein LOC123545371 n=1 Tax=Mercenaria mercenaria TaxID=6596 RepID=UPI001E1D9168|nr:uncharacterized protein LOC123545371 [Mercenaria mercenaria]
MKVVCICLVLVLAVADAGHFKRAPPPITQTSTGGLIELNGYGNSKGLVCDNGGDNIAKVACGGNGYESFTDVDLSEVEWSITLSCTGDESDLNGCTRVGGPVGATNGCNGAFAGCASKKRSFW